LNREEILIKAQESILKCDKIQALNIARETLMGEFSPLDVLTNGFSAGIRKMGDLFGRGEVFLPELMLAADVMKEVTGVLNEAIQTTQTQKKGIMVIATVEGDVHDIGKGIVVSLIKTQGIDVIDLGRDVPVSKIIEKAVELKADLIGTSALLTTTLVEQKKLEEELRRHKLRDQFKTMVGGAPATQRWADRIGADAYGEDAAEAVSKALELLDKK
jgi:trimethylamine corrinoid protein